MIRHSAPGKLSAEASLEIPRFVFPFLSNKHHPEKHGPKNQFSPWVRSFQKNIGSRQTKIYRHY